MTRVVITDAYFPSAEAEKWSTRLQARLFNLDAVDFAEFGPFLTSEETWAIWTQAHELAQEWYISKGQDCTLYQGISIGKILEIEMWYYWRDLFEQIEVLKRVTSLVNPTEIYLATSKNKQIACLLQDFELVTVPVKSISPSLVCQLATWKDMETVRHRLKARNLDRFIRLASLFFNKLKYGRKTPPHSPKNTVLDVLAILEQPAAYLAESILPVLAFFPNRGILLMDPRHQQRAAQSGSEVIYQTDFFGSKILHFWRMHKLFSEHYQAHQRQFSQTLQYKGKSLESVAAGKLRHLFRWVFPLVALEIAGAKQLFAERVINSLLLVTDAHHGGRLYTLVANQQGIPSLVVQHGATVGDWGYVPLYATRFAAWGEISAEWMVTKGVPCERLVVTGQPRLDNLVNDRRAVTRDTLSERLNLTSVGFWLLWAMDPIPKFENDRVLQILLETMVHLPWCHLIIRPHPGIQQLGWILGSVRGRERVAVSSVSESLYDILHAVDALVIQGSTVGIEAMAMDKPVLVLQERDSPANALYIQSGAATQVSRADELAEALTGIYNCQQTGKVDALTLNRRDFVRRYLLEVDGQSARRVANALAALQKDR